MVGTTRLRHAGRLRHVVRGKDVPGEDATACYRVPRVLSIAVPVGGSLVSFGTCTFNVNLIVQNNHLHVENPDQWSRGCGDSRAGVAVGHIHSREFDSLHPFQM